MGAGGMGGGAAAGEGGAMAAGAAENGAMAGEMAGHNGMAWSGTNLFRRGMQALGAISGGMIGSSMYGG